MVDVKGSSFVKRPSVEKQKPKTCKECPHYEEDCEGEEPNTDCDQWSEEVSDEYDFYEQGYDF